MTSRLHIAIRAARAGGRVLREQFYMTRQIRSKGKHDIVTDADYASERTIQNMLCEQLPQDLFISEEGDPATLQQLWDRLEADPTLYGWVVDPLDGTTNYAQRLSPFAVSMALYRAGGVDMGVVFDPIRNELFAAERGRGAVLNGQPIRVSTTESIDDAILGMDWGRAPRARRRSGDLLRRMVDRVTTARTTGSAALALCYAAAGRFDVYYHLSLQPWDVAAGALIVEEAGGRVTDATGTPWSVHSRSYVATNGRLHRAVLRYFHP